MAETDGDFQLLDWQTRGMAIPDGYCKLYAGGRGGGKSRAMQYEIVRHCERFGPLARVLVIRQTLRGLEDFKLALHDLLVRVYGTAVRFNHNEGIFRLPNGAYVELGQLENAGDYGKYQGRSFTLLCIDEAGQYADPTLLFRLFSNLRGRKGMPIIIILAANPGDPGHHWVAAMIFNGAGPWEPFTEEKTGRVWVVCPSTYLDNVHIDREEYRRQLEASCPNDPELLAAWLAGDWSVVRGAFFASVLSEKRNAFGPWDPNQWTREARFRRPEPVGARYLKAQIVESDLPTRGQWQGFLSLDWGSAAPCVAYLCMRSPGEVGPDGKWYARDSILAVDEVATNEPGSLTRGMGYTVPRVAEEILTMCDRWGVRPEGVADDSIFIRGGLSVGSVADEFLRCGIRFEPAMKGLRSWETMKRMLADAGEPDKAGIRPVPTLVEENQLVAVRGPFVRTRSDRKCCSQRGFLEQVETQNL